MTGSDRLDASDPRTYFGHLAAVYDRHRPTYAAAAIDFILDRLGNPIRAADIGAGTGISTRLLATRGVQTVGVEPDETMRAVADGRSADLDPPPTYRAGTGEATGLESGSVDLVLVAQAFHWFDPPVALAEFQRILRPEGRLALAWNVRSAAAPGFTGVYEDVVRRSQDHAEQRGMIVRRGRSGQDVALDPWFVGPRTRSFENAQTLDWAGVRGRIGSTSYFPPEGDPARAELERMLRAAFDRDAGAAGTVRLEQVTRVTIATRA
ncbi:MAG: methyltransferase domain-containing protein [Planctomycetota bacterium]|jgi:SAM-dependent methyltransferase